MKSKKEKCNCHCHSGTVGCRSSVTMKRSCEKNHSTPPQSSRLKEKWETRFTREFADQGYLVRGQVIKFIQKVSQESYAKGREDENEEWVESEYK